MSDFCLTNFMWNPKEQDTDHHNNRELCPYWIILSLKIYINWQSLVPVIENALVATVYWVHQA